MNTQSSSPDGDSPIQIHPALISLLPGYLGRRREEIQKIPELVKTQNYASLRDIGHRLIGNASTYGFIKLSKVGSELEEAALAQNERKILQILTDFENCVNHIEMLAAKAKS